MSILNNLIAFWKLGEAYDADVFRDAVGDHHLIPNLRIGPSTSEFTLGASLNRAFGPGPRQHSHARLKGWGKWNRLLTPAEKKALANVNYWPFTARPSLSDANAYFPLDEPGGSSLYRDATGRGNDLVSAGAETQRRPGPSGGSDHATNFPRGAYLSKKRPQPDLRSGQHPTTIAGWVYLNRDLRRTQHVFWAQLLSGTDSGFNVYYENSGAGRFMFDCSAGTGKDLSAGVIVVDNRHGRARVETWYLLIAEFDLARNRATLSTNNGRPNALGNILQPAPAEQGEGSKFVLNRPGRFGPPKSAGPPRSGWDINKPVRGNCHLYYPPKSPGLYINRSSKTVFGWFWAASVSGTQTLAGFWGGPGNPNATQWVIQLQGQKVRFLLGKSLHRVEMRVTGRVWHLVVAWFDSEADEIGIAVDDGKPVTASGPFAPNTTVENSFRLGSDASNGGNGGQFVGNLKNWGIANGVPSPSDLKVLWSNHPLLVGR